MQEKMRKLVRDDTLCSNNLLVKFHLNNIKKKLKKLGLKDAEIYDTINDAQEVLRIMKKQGQKIEDRARLYRTTIEDVLGFKRIKKGRK